MGSVIISKDSPIVKKGLEFVGLNSFNLSSLLQDFSESLIHTLLEFSKKET